MYNTNVDLEAQQFSFISIQSKLNTGSVNQHAKAIFMDYVKKLDLPVYETSLGLYFFDEFIRVEGTYSTSLNVRTDWTSIIIKMDKCNKGRQLYFYKNGKFENIFEILFCLAN